MSNGKHGGQRPAANPGDSRRDKQHEENKQKVAEIKKRIEALAYLSAYGARQLVKDAETLANISKHRELKTAQIRKIYGTVKNLELDFRSGKFQSDKVFFLLPKLAYAANKKGEVRDLQEVLSACINKIREGADGAQDFQRFVNFFEAILAYHR
jgi:CRISPR-associated protein Csm2